MPSKFWLPTALITALILVVAVYNSDRFYDYRNTQAQSEWKFSGWKYRRVATINNPTSKTINNYPATLSLSPSNFSWSKAKSDGSDLRITTLDGTEIPYWIRNYDSNAKEARISVKLPKLVSGNNQIYIYYGNSNATSKSNGKATFDYYQDFNNFNPTVKFGIITDIHHDSNDHNYWNTPDFEQGWLTDGRGRMNKFVQDMNSWNADFVITLGDLITSENFSAPSGSQITGDTVESPQEALTALKQIESVYDNFNGKRYYALDNHEFYNLALDANHKKNPNDLTVFPNIGGQGATLNSKNGDMVSYFDFGDSEYGVRFIILDLQYINDTTHRGPENNSDYGIGYLPAFQRQWLQNKISTSPHPIVIFSSHGHDQTDFLYGTACNNYPTSYCTESRCSSNYPDAGCIQSCKNVGDYRRTSNSAQIHNILVPYKDKILAVFQGDDHMPMHYVHDGIHYWTLDSADQASDNAVAYTKVRIDPNQKLLEIEGVGGTNNSNVHKISYDGGKMNISNSRDLFFQPALLPIGTTFNDDVMVEADWQFIPNASPQQVAIGFWQNMDHLNVRHQCANPGRFRKSNFVGQRRVRASNGNFIGTERHINGSKNTTLDNANNSTSGHFWTHLSGGKVRFWYSSPEGGAKLATEYTTSGMPLLNPGIWTFDNLGGSTTAKIDNFIVRKATYPEPETKSISGEEVYTPPTNTPTPKPSTPTPKPPTTPPTKTPTPTLADLVVSNISVSPSSPHNNDDLDFAVTVKNQGNETASNFRVTFGFNRIDGSGYSVIDKLEPNATTLINRTIGRGFTNIGENTYYATVDSTEVVPESNENNNTKSLAINVLPNPTFTPTPAPQTSTPKPATATPTPKPSTPTPKPATTTPTITPTDTPTSTPTGPTSTPVQNGNQFVPTDDVYVKGQNPDNNYSGDNLLLTSDYSSNQNETFIKFDLSSLAGKTITAATLRLTPALERNVNKIVSVATSSEWSESTLTYNTRPQIGNQIGSISLSTIVGNPVNIGLDVSPLQQYVGKNLTLAITNTGTDDTFSVYSKETSNTVDRPTLIIQTSDSGATSTPTSTPHKEGDANGDGKVDGLDYVIWLNNYNTNTGEGPAKGDFNNNGFVDGVDYVIWLSNYSN